MYYLVYVVQIGGNSINGGKTLYGVKLRLKLNFNLLVVALSRKFFWKLLNSENLYHYFRYFNK